MEHVTKPASIMLGMAADRRTCFLRSPVFCRPLWAPDQGWCVSAAQKGVHEEQFKQSEGFPFENKCNPPGSQIFKLLLARSAFTSRSRN